MISSPTGGWFSAARFGLFVHFGPYAAVGRGEQVLLREWLDHQAYAAAACAWNPARADAREWAVLARQAGMKYAVLTARHHDGYCLWATDTTDYSSAAQAPRRDFVREFVTACRAEGLRVGIYYSWADFRIPAYFQGPQQNPAGWERFRRYVHAQVIELMSRYGPVDVLWFDGEWPHSADTWQSAGLLAEVRRLQPGILVNNRLGHRAAGSAPNAEGLGQAHDLGDFGTPEHHITADTHRPWESCQVSTWRLWGYAAGERWRPADLLLDMLVEAAAKGGNLLLNVGPDGEGRFPEPFVERLGAIGRWMQTHGEAIYGSQRAGSAGWGVGGELFDFTTFGRVIKHPGRLYLVFRFWDGSGTVRFPFLKTPITAATLLTTGRPVAFSQDGEYTTLSGLPKRPPTELFPVVRLDFDTDPEPTALGCVQQWTGDPLRYLSWAGARGTGVNADGSDPAT